MNTSSKVFFGRQSSIIPGLEEVSLIQDIIGLGEDSKEDIVQEFKDAVKDILDGEQPQEETPEKNPEESEEKPPTEHIVNLSFIGKLKKIFNL